MTFAGLTFADQTFADGCFLTQHLIIIDWLVVKRARRGPKGFDEASFDNNSNGIILQIRNPAVKKGLNSIQPPNSFVFYIHISPNPFRLQKFWN